MYKEITARKIETAFAGFIRRDRLKAVRVADAHHPLALENGAVLPEIWVAYETYGQLSEQKDNVILVEHALTGDSHPAAHHEHDDIGWWEPLIGPGRPIDTNEFFVICSNVLGGCQGTTGPASPNPATGKPYGMSFPQITIRDMVHVQKRLLEALDIPQVALVIGGSMGGMQALEWAVTYPDCVEGVVAIAAPGYATAQAIAYNKVGREAVMLDPDWQGGDYYGGAGPARGMSVARALGMITYQSDFSMTRKFGRNTRNGNFEVENYLAYQGERLVKRFDANAYLYLLRALDSHDLGSGFPAYAAALGHITARVLVIGVSSDILYPAYQQAELADALRRQGVRAEYQVIESPHGHDGFLIDFPILQPMIYRFIRALRSPRKRERPLVSSLFRAADMAYLGARLITEI